MVLTARLPWVSVTEKNPAKLFGRPVDNKFFTTKNAFLFILTDKPQPTPASLGVLIIELGIPRAVKYPENLTVCSLERKETTIYSIFFSPLHNPFVRFV